MLLTSDLMIERRRGEEFKIIFVTIPKILDLSLTDFVLTYRNFTLGFLRFKEERSLKKKCKSLFLLSRRMFS